MGPGHLPSNPWPHWHSAARTRSTGEVRAVKHLLAIFDAETYGRQALREIKILRHLRGHENVRTARASAPPLDVPRSP